jgi:GTP cyclohydrolase FolE2
LPVASIVHQPSRRAVARLRRTEEKNMPSVTSEKKFLVDVGMDDLPFPIRAHSKVDPNGQPTIANISVRARVMHEFEPQWIDKFIQLVHSHRDRLGTQTLRGNVPEYMTELNASTVRVTFEYPFFVEKVTPVAKEKCLVKYACAYTAKAQSPACKATAVFKIKVPCITTYPTSDASQSGGAFGQLSVFTIEIQSTEDVYPEDVVAMVDRHALAPVYSFLTPADQLETIRTIHSVRKTSVATIDAIKSELARREEFKSYSVECANYGMLHSYGTILRTEKSMWVPFSGYETDEI